MNSYGKTWHIWNTGFHEGKPADLLPVGNPMLAWSFSRDGEAMSALVEKRDRKMDLNTIGIRRKRADLGEFAIPQSGVDDLKDKFGRPTQGIRRVVDTKSINNQSGQ